MSLARNIRNIKEVMQMAGDITLGRYPSFVYGRGLRADEVPSFCFHGVRAADFEDVLRYMKENGYTNLTAKDYYQIRLGKMAKPERAIMISFDDGTSSMWSVAYPLLKKYGFQATVFLIPGRISHQQAARKTLEAVWEGNAPLEEVDGYDQSELPFASWEEVSEMHRSGVMDFQSHGMWHRQIFISPEIVDYVNPDNVARYSPFQFSTFDELNQSTLDKSALPLGAPIYRSAPRLADHLRYKEDITLKQACVAYVTEQGGERYFKESNWRLMLARFVRDYRSKNRREPEFESKEEQQAEMRNEMVRSKAVIKEKLPGKKACHFCFPWGVSGQASLNMLEAAGYVTAYTGRLGANLKLTLTQDPKRLYRIGPDFFYLLPGEGRDSLSQVLSRKLTKRARKGTHHISY